MVYLMFSFIEFWLTQQYLLQWSGILLKGKYLPSTITPMVKLAPKFTNPKLKFSKQSKKKAQSDSKLKAIHIFPFNLFNIPLLQKQGRVNSEGDK